MSSGQEMEMALCLHCVSKNAPTLERSSSEL